MTTNKSLHGHFTSTHFVDWSTRLSSSLPYFLLTSCYLVDSVYSTVRLATSTCACSCPPSSSSRASALRMCGAQGMEAEAGRSRYAFPHSFSWDRLMQS